MKKITCDICKKVIGVEVGVGMYTVSTTEYNPRGFSDGFFVNKKEIADICNECSDVIVNAQNEAIKSLTQEK